MVSKRIRTRLQLQVLANQQKKEGRISLHCQPRWKSSGGGFNGRNGNGGSGKKVERSKLTRIDTVPRIGQSWAMNLLKGCDGHWLVMATDILAWNMGYQIISQKLCVHYSRKGE